ncbi:hypothetical protein TNCV_2975241 [Trichonephila clavipes]|nr:hypothetical protein TNCV_2975241 [Trichonephila clavipes]
MTKLSYEYITRSFRIDECRITEFFSSFIVNFGKHVRLTLPDMIVVDKDLKIAQRLPGLVSLCDKRGVVSYEDLLTINGTKYSTFQEAARVAGLLKSEDSILEALDDAALVMNLTEEEGQERLVREKKTKNRNT